MAFVLSLLYIAVTLLSPGAFPDVIMNLHINLILGGILIFVLPLKLLESKAGTRPETYLGIGLLISTTLSTLATGWITGSVTTFLDFAPVVIVFYMVAIACNSLTRLKILVYVMLGVAIFILIQGLTAIYGNGIGGSLTSPYIYFERMGTELSSGTVSAMVPRLRGLGIISDPNDLAQLYVTLIPLLWLRWKPGHMLSNTFFTIVPATVLTVGIYYTHSRGGALALVAVIMFGLKDKLSSAGSTILGFLAMIGLLAINITGGRGIGEDDGGRVAAWAIGLQTLKSHPILGIGPGNYNDITGTGHTAHNSFVLAVVELGFVGYFFWFGMIMSAWNGLSLFIRAHAPPKKLSARRARFLAIHEPSAQGSAGDATGSNVLTAPAGVAAMFSATPKERATILPSNLEYSFRSRPVPLHRVQRSEEDIRTEQLIIAAKTIRVSFVGLLVAGFFLSRTYAAPLYVMLGMAVVIINLDPERPDVNIPNLIRRTLIGCVVSVLLLYLGIRLHGGK